MLPDDNFLLTPALLSDAVETSVKKFIQFSTTLALYASV